MTRRLFYLNALLVLGCIGFGMRLRMMWLEEREREEIVQLTETRKLRYPGQAPSPQVQSVNAMNYSDVAMRLLFSKDRNPLVIPPEPPPKPPPPPEPPFPKYNGVMMGFGDPKVILSQRGTDNQKIYKFGDKVGEWEIARFDSKTITLRWNDKEVTKDYTELIDSAPIPPPQAVMSAQSAAAGAAPAAGGGTSSAATIKGGGSDSGKPKENIDLGNGTRGCAPGDTSANGTVVDGMKKVIVANPFGVSCHWEPVR